jgi:hypothetical protein
METKLPRLDDAIRASIEQFISKIMAAEFHSRQFSESLPELLIEALRIEQEAHRDQ